VNPLAKLQKERDEWMDLASRHLDAEHEERNAIDAIGHVLAGDPHDNDYRLDFFGRRKSEDVLKLAEVARDKIAELKAKLKRYDDLAVERTLAYIAHSVKEMMK
jgi:hypothetical protein